MTLLMSVSIYFTLLCVVLGRKKNSRGVGSTSCQVFFMQDSVERTIVGFEHDMIAHMLGRITLDIWLTCITCCPEC